MIPRIVKKKKKTLQFPHLMQSPYTNGTFIHYWFCIKARIALGILTVLYWAACKLLCQTTLLNVGYIYSQHTLLEYRHNAFCVDDCGTSTLRLLLANIPAYCVIDIFCAKSLQTHCKHISIAKFIVIMLTVYHKYNSFIRYNTVDILGWSAVVWGFWNFRNWKILGFVFLFLFFYYAIIVFNFILKKK